MIHKERHTSSRREEVACLSNDPSEHSNDAISLREIERKREGERERRETKFR